MRQRAEGGSIRATARIMECDKDTVCHWRPRVGRPGPRRREYFFRRRPLSECQLEERWPLVYKKEERLTALEKRAGRYGDTWVWAAFDPVGKIVPAWRVGKRTRSEARTFSSTLKTNLDDPLPLFTREDLPHDADALLEGYGER